MACRDGLLHRHSLLILTVGDQPGSCAAAGGQGSAQSLSLAADVVSSTKQHVACRARRLRRRSLLILAVSHQPGSRAAAGGQGSAQPDSLSLAIRPRLKH